MTLLSHLKKQKGTSISEAIVLLTVLIPLAIAIPRLAKIGDFKMQTPQATRYLGWQEAMSQRTLGSTDARTHLQERIFKSNDIPIQTDVQASSTENERQFWYDQFNKNGGSGILDTTNEDHLLVTRTTESDESITRSTMNGTNAAINTIGLGLLDDFNFNDGGGVITHNVNYTINSFGIANGCDSEDGTLCMQSKHTLFYGGLAAASPSEIQNQVNTLKPLSGYELPFRLVANLARLSYIFGEGRALRNVPEHVDTEALPDNLLIDSNP